MPSALDLRIDEITRVLTGPGGPMETSDTIVNAIPLPMITTAPATLPLYFAYFCGQHADKPFLVAGEERLNFAQVHAAARKVAGALIEGRGIKKGDRVGIAMRNAPTWIALYMGILMAGGVATLLNAWWQGPELVDGINEVGASLLLVDHERARRLAEAGFADMPVITFDLERDLDTAIAPLLAKGGGETTTLPDITGDGIATILFTSGSTGQSKGAFHSHRSVVQGTFNYIMQALVMLQIATQDGPVGPTPPQPCALLAVPLFHVTGEIPLLLVSFAIGRKIVMMPKWGVVTAMKLIEREKVTTFTGVPLMSFELASHPDRPKYDLSSLQALSGGGAPRPLEHVKRLSENFPTAPPALGYGLTETNGVGAGNFLSNYQEKPLSTGRASKPLVEVAILDDTGNALTAGERGEIAIRSIANFNGYWGREDATRAAIMQDGFFRTGDVGYLDDDGYLFIVDRTKDTIIRGGENISCVEVEAALYEHPAVAEACVFGLPNERFGEVVGAVVYLHPGMVVDQDAILSQMRDNVAAFKVPQQLWIEAIPLPRLGTEKIDKVGLRKRFQQQWLQEQPG